MLRTMEYLFLIQFAAKAFHMQNYIYHIISNVIAVHVIETKTSAHDNDDVDINNGQQ